MVRVTSALARRLHQQAGADRWRVTIDAFAAVLERSARKAPGDDEPALERYLSSLHLEDLALAAACESGDESAWEHFILEFRPALYRAATAMAGESGRELADSLYADLFGLKEKDGVRQSLFRYFHGRSSLATWLRAVLAQRHVDGIRSGRRLEPLPEDESPHALGHADAAAETRAERQGLVARLQLVLAAALGRLAPRDRLRLGWYYGQEMTLAQIGRMTGEHEATVSRHLSRTRKVLRADVEQELAAAGMTPAQIDECFAEASRDPGPLDLAELLDEGERKEPVLDRSRSEDVS
ncbi:MAG: sigma-70 family RNA polymerase sigma factor [Vicinamibacterales bacterium]